MDTLQTSHCSDSTSGNPYGILMELQRYQNLALRKDVGLVLLGLPETPSLLLLRLKGLYEKDARW